MRENSHRYPTRQVVCYCTGCLKGINEGGNEAVHVLDLILADDPKEIIVHETV